MNVENERIGLSERWTRIDNILPSELAASTNHPNFMVDPNGFRRVVRKSLNTCEGFLDTLKKIEDGLEKRIVGITSYYGLVVAPNKQSHVVKNFGGMVSISGSTVLLPTYGMAMAADRGFSSIEQPQPTPPEPPKEMKTAIFEKLGGAILRNNRKIDNEETIAFNRALEILSKIDDLRSSTSDCIATFGALDEVLELGKLFTHRTEQKVHYLEHHTVDEHINVEESQMPLYNYWAVLSKVNRIRTIEKKLKPEVKGL